MSDELTGTAAQFVPEPEQKKVEAGEGFTIYVERSIPRGGYEITMFVSYEASRMPREVFESQMSKALSFWTGEALNVYDQMRARIAEIQIEEAAEQLL